MQKQMNSNISKYVSILTRCVTTPICRLYRPFWTQKNDGDRPPRKGKRRSVFPTERDGEVP